MTEPEIIQKLQQGNEQAFKQLVDNYTNVETLISRNADKGGGSNLPGTRVSELVYNNKNLFYHLIGFFKYFFRLLLSVIIMLNSSSF